MDLMLFKQRLKVIPLIFFLTLKIMIQKCPISKKNNTNAIISKNLNNYKNKKTDE